jgi:hypothetical protein
LNGNNLTGAIPFEIANAPRLTALNLDFNSLSNTIPSNLGNTVALKSLSLENNTLTGTIPKELGNLGSLQELRLRYNSFDGSVPEELCSSDSNVDIVVDCDMPCSCCSKLFCNSTKEDTGMQSMTSSSRVNNIFQKRL